MAQYDEIIKHLMDRFAVEFASLSFGTTDVQVLETLDTEQQTIKVHRNDMSYKVLWQNQTVLLHIEVQTEDSRDKPMPLRVLSYASALLLRYELPVYSVVLYLSPNAGHNDPGGYRYGNDDFGLQFMYQVIQFSKLDGDSFLDSEMVGLLPFMSLMNPPKDMTTEAWLQECVEKIESAPVDTKTRGTLLFALSLLGGLVHDPTLFQKLISEDIMQESPFYELVIQRGARENSIKNILTVLTKRFPNSDVNPVAQGLESVLDIDYLTELLNNAIDTPSVEVFLQELNATET